MSEFSDCYYLLNATTEEVVFLLKKARRYGLVLSAMGCHVPFLVDGSWDAGKLSDLVVENNSGLLLHYSYAEEHGLWMTVYESHNEAFTIDIQRRGRSENDLGAILAEVERLNLVTRDRCTQLRAILEEVALEDTVELSRVQTQLSEIFGIDFFSWLGCADLSAQSQKNLSQRFPDATFVLKSQRGKADKAIKPTPNRWCPQPDLPAFMYLPVPDGVINETLLEQHIKHWIETQDWDEDRQAGCWLYTAYCRTLPSRMRYLANRIMNLGLAFGDEMYEAELRRTIRGILAVTDSTFDWQPYLNKMAGEQRL
ncbi:MAG: hypothetical protein DCF22_16845 [Leptolyngbya sp.]|nr:MAG: hypothetical protein DCF22_16845 [Leptolyngbya sp.]